MQQGSSQGEAGKSSSHLGARRLHLHTRCQTRICNQGLSQDLSPAPGWGQGMDVSTTAATGDGSSGGRVQWGLSTAGSVCNGVWEQWGVVITGSGQRGVRGQQRPGAMGSGCKGAWMQRDLGAMGSGCKGTWVMAPCAPPPGPCRLSALQTHACSSQCPRTAVAQ